MIEIYFDGILLDNSNYMAFNVNFQPFEKEFYLGSTGSITASLTIPKGALPQSLTSVVIKLDGENWYHCVVDAIEENDNEEYVLSLTDKLIETEVGYDFSDKVPISAKVLLENICTDFNIPHDEFNFTNQDVEISSYDSTITAREYLSMIGELAGGYITINKEGKLEVKSYGRKSRNLFNSFAIVADDYIDVDDDGTILVFNCNGSNGYTATNKTLAELCPSIKVGDTIYIRIDTDFMGDNGKLKTLIHITGAKINWYTGTALEITEEILNGKVIVYGGYETTSHIQITILKDVIPDFYEKYGTVFTLLPDANTITADDVDTFKIKNTITIQRVVWEFVSSKMESSEDESLYTVYLDGNNLFLQKMTNEMFTNICNNIIGLTLSNIKISTTNKFFNDKKILKFVDRENKSYNILPSFEADYCGGFVGSYESDLDNAKQNETKVRNTTERVRRIKQIVDQDSNTLKIAVEDITEQKEVINLELQTSIKANTTLIEQTSGAIRQEVSEKEGALRGEINTVQKDLDDTEKSLQGLINENKSSIEILSQSITSTVKSIGGNNLLRNSVGFAKTLNDDNIYELDFWKTINPQNISSIQDADTEATTTSGSKIVFSNAGKIEQEYTTQIGMWYGVSLKLKHKINGGTANNIKIHIIGGENQLEVLTTSQQTQAYNNFTQLSEFTYKATIGSPKIVIETDGDDLIEISDLIISQGENQAWSCYFDEIYGKEHRLDKYGLKLTDLATQDYSHQTVNALKFVDNGAVAAEISQNQAKSNAGRFNNEISLRTLQWIVLDDDNIIEYIE